MFKYMSDFSADTLKPADFNKREVDAVIIPLPKPDITPPVTKMKMFRDGTLTTFFSYWKKNFAQAII